MKQRLKSIKILAVSEYNLYMNGIRIPFYTHEIAGCGYTDKGLCLRVIKWLPPDGIMTFSIPVQTDQNSETFVKIAREMGWTGIKDGAEYFYYPR